MSEFFDIYDESLAHIGVKEREQVHRDGDWHQAFHCWVVGRAPDGAPFVILQKRGTYVNYPGKVDVSAAGHLAAGELPRDGIRELQEELGLHVPFEALVPLGRRVGIAKLGDFIDCQICHVYLYESAQPLAVYDYQREEIAGLLQLPLAAGIRLLSGRASTVRVPALGLGSATVQVRAHDFIQSIDNYALKALLLIQRYFAGETDLWI